MPIYLKQLHLARHASMPAMASGFRRATEVYETSRTLVISRCGAFNHFAVLMKELTFDTRGYRSLAAREGHRV